MRGTRGGTRGSGPLHPPSLENHKAIGFLSNTGPDPLENHNANKPVFNVGQSSDRQQNAILMAFRWWSNDGPLLVLFGSCPLSAQARYSKDRQYLIKCFRSMTMGSSLLPLPTKIVPCHKHCLHCFLMTELTSQHKSK